MKRCVQLLSGLLLAARLYQPFFSVQAQTTAFTYQGQLVANGAPANGAYSFIFVLYTAAIGGDQVGPVLTNTDVAVSGGLFTSTLNFGPGIFTGTNYWLDISVATNGTTAFLELSPRQPLNPVPYAIYAASASNAVTAMNATGQITDSQLSANIPRLNGGAAFTGTVSGAGFTGSGTGLTGVNAVSVGGSQLTTSGLPGLNLNTNIYLHDNPIFLRSDQNHGLAYNGLTITNFPSGSVLPDGPVLWGFTGGALGQLNGGAAAALSWNNSGVTVSNALSVGGNAIISGNATISSNATISGNALISGNLSANNTPGVAWSQSNTSTNLPNDASLVLDSCTPAKPSSGYLVITATANILNNKNTISLALFDTTSGLIPLTATADSSLSGGASTLSMTWVLPVSAGGHEDLATFVESSGSGSVVNSHSLVVMFFPRLDN